MGQKRILFIDDNQGLQLVLKVLLEKHGYRVYQAKNGEEAIGFLATHAPVDLVVLDLRMPTLNGVEFLKAMKDDRAFQETPLVILSGDPNAGQVAATFGAQAYIPKGGDTNHFLDTIRKLTAA